MNQGKLWLAAVAISGVAVGCHGNTGNGTQGATGTSGSADVNGGPTMTLTGCVQDGTPAGTYVLKSAPSARDTQGTSGRKSGGQDVNGVMTEQGEATYRLIPTGNLDFGQNVGKEVSATGQLASQAQDNNGAAGTSGSTGNDQGTPGNSGSSSGGDRTQRQGTKGQGDAGTNLESGGSQGSGGGRVQGDARDEDLGARFFRVTSMTKIADKCTTGSAQEQR